MNKIRNPKSRIISRLAERLLTLFQGLSLLVLLSREFDIYVCKQVRFTKTTIILDSIPGDGKRYYSASQHADMLWGPSNLPNWCQGCFLGDKAVGA